MTSKPRLVIAASSETFDHATIHRWKHEGFDVHYEHVHGDSRSSIYAVEAHGDNLESGESYAIVRCHPPAPLYAFYPERIPLIFTSYYHYQPHVSANIQ